MRQIKMAKLHEHLGGAAVLALNNALTQSFVYFIGFIFRFSSVIAIGSFLAYLSATIVGSLALYIPLLLLKQLLEYCHASDSLVAYIIDWAYLISSPIVGALILNAAFAMTLPLMPVALCSLIGSAICLFIKAIFYGSSAQNAPVDATENATQYNNYTKNPSFDKNFFNNAMPGYKPQNYSAYDNTVIIEELDNSGNVIHKQTY
jgi:ABC-type transport system involved in multi-copper enzyme maturation permease subunit